MNEYQKKIIMFQQRLLDIEQYEFHIGNFYTQRDVDNLFREVFLDDKSVPKQKILPFKIISQ